MAKHYEPDSRGLVDVAKSKQMGAAMRGIAESALAGAPMLSPVASGKYRDSFRVVDTTAKAGWKMDDRAAARIENTAPHASAVERNHKVLGRLASIIEGG